MLAQRIAVVGGEDDVGVVELAGALERRHRVGHRVVDGEQRPDPREVELLHFTRFEHRAATDDGLLVAHVGLVEARRLERLGRQALERCLVRRLGRRVEATPVAVTARLARRGHPHVRGNVVGEDHEGLLAGPVVDVGQGPLVEAGGDVVVGVGVAVVEREVLVVRGGLEQDVEVVPAGSAGASGSNLFRCLPWIAVA